MKILRTVLLFLIVFSSVSAKEKKNYPYELSICAIFRDEARFLKEWIEFHRMVGVQDFYLYNNLSEDNYLEVLEPYVRQGIVDLIQWPYESIEYARWTHTQLNAYRDALKRVKNKTRWLAILDTDEFLSPVSGSNLREILKQFEGYGGVKVNWQCYSTSDVEKVGEDELMIERLLWKAPWDIEDNHIVKSIVRPEKVKECKNPHYVHFAKGWVAVNENFEPMPGIQTTYVSIDKMRITHYWTRDETFFRDVKVKREKKFERDLRYCYGKKERYSQVYDDFMLRFVPAMRQRIFQLEEVKE